MELQLLAEDIWIVDGETVRWFSMPFPTRMTLVRLHSGELFVHSPTRLTPDVRREVESVGTVRHIVSPNKIHHLFMSEWAETFPGARLYAPPGLAGKRKDLVFHGELKGPETFPWSGEIDQVVFGGSRFMDEVVFFHRASKTVILGDLIENFDPAQLSWFHRTLARFAGVLAPHGGTPRDFRMTFRDHRETRQALDRMREWAPERILFAHGLWVDQDATGFLDRAFSWVRG